MANAFVTRGIEGRIQTLKGRVETASSPFMKNGILGRIETLMQKLPEDHPLRQSAPQPSAPAAAQLPAQKQTVQTIFIAEMERLRAGKTLGTEEEEKTWTAEAFQKAITFALELQEGVERKQSFFELTAMYRNQNLVESTASDEVRRTLDLKTNKTLTELYEEQLEKSDSAMNAFRSIFINIYTPNANLAKDILKNELKQTLDTNKKLNYELDLNEEMDGNTRIEFYNAINKWPPARSIEDRIKLATENKRTCGNAFEVQVNRVIRLPDGMDKTIALGQLKIYAQRFSMDLIDCLGKARYNSLVGKINEPRLPPCRLAPGASAPPRPQTETRTPIPQAPRSAGEGALPLRPGDGPILGRPAIGPGTPRSPGFALPSSTIGGRRATPAEDLGRSSAPVEPTGPLTEPPARTPIREPPQTRTVEDEAKELATKTVGEVLSFFVGLGEERKTALAAAYAHELNGESISSILRKISDTDRNIAQTAMQVALEIAADPNRTRDSRKEAFKAFLLGTRGSRFDPTTDYVDEKVAGIISEENVPKNLKEVARKFAENMTVLGAEKAAELIIDER